MRSDDDAEAFEREFRTGRLQTAALLEEAYAFLPPDAACRAAIDGYRQFATLRDYHPRAHDHLVVALERLEASAERGGASAEFWITMKDIAIFDGFYDEAVRYRDRATTA
jgi:hypothetical protein